VLTGNLDRAGGAMFPLAPHKRPGTGSGRGFRLGRWSSRVRGFPEVKGELPAAVMAEEMSTPGEGQIRAMITVAGNPVLSTPDGAALDAALADLEFMVAVDPYLNETTRRSGDPATATAEPFGTLRHRVLRPGYPQHGQVQPPKPAVGGGRL
jgi:anaerobic selenocysteine-containing dehydrogenase